MKHNNLTIQQVRNRIACGFGSGVIFNNDYREKRPRAIYVPINNHFKAISFDRYFLDNTNYTVAAFGRYAVYALFTGELP